MRKRDHKSLFGSGCLGVALLGLVCTSMSAAPLIYEPFDYAEGQLSGQTATGLTGGWSGSATINVVSNSLSYGGLLTEGNKLALTDRNGPSKTAPIGTTLSGAGLMDDGATLWFSLLWSTSPAPNINYTWGLSLGTDALLGNNSFQMENSGNGMGVYLTRGNQVGAITWSGGSSSKSATTVLSEGEVYFVVGEIIWGANGTATDTVNIYLPDTDLALGSIIQSQTAVLNQSAFDVISIGSRSDDGEYADEIRFGATYEDVAITPPPPPPAGTVITIW